MSVLDRFFQRFLTSSPWISNCDCRTATLAPVYGGAAVRFDPRSQTELAGALECLLNSYSTEHDLIRRGREHAATCGWTASGEAFAVAIEQTLAG
jgi:hypothetical protein